MLLPVFTASQEIATSWSVESGYSTARNAVTLVVDDPASTAPLNFKLRIFLDSSARVWFRCCDVAAAFGYATPDSAVRELVLRNADPSDPESVKLWSELYDPERTAVLSARSTPLVEDDAANVERQAFATYANLTRLLAITSNRNDGCSLVADRCAHCRERFAEWMRITSTIMRDLTLDHMRTVALRLDRLERVMLRDTVAVAPGA